jgi:crossover junction endodeoxyribonuclease RusA
MTARIVIAVLGVGVPHEDAAVLGQAIANAAREIGCYGDVQVGDREVTATTSRDPVDPAHLPCPRCGRPVGRYRTGAVYRHLCRAVHVIALPYERPPLNLNDGDGGGNPHAARAERKKVRADLGWVFKAARLGGPHRHIEVQLHYRPARNGRRDRDNLVATLKPLADALVDVEVVPDDTEQFMSKPMPIIEPATTGLRGAVWATVTVIDPYQEPRP